jgi:hypothetical protein
MGELPVGHALHDGKNIRRDESLMRGFRRGS